MILHRHMINDSKYEIVGSIVRGVFSKLESEIWISLWTEVSKGRLFIRFDND